MRLSFAAALCGALALAACGSEPEALTRPVIADGANVVAPEAPYDAALDAQAGVDAAFAQAQAEGKRVLVKFGGNWCPDCRILAGMMELPAFAAFIDQAYVVVSVDVGRYDRNMDVVERFGFEALEGVPTVVVATADGHVVNRASAAEWRTARERDPQEAADYFFELATQAPPTDADRVETVQG